VPISALTGEGLDALKAAMAECLRKEERLHELVLPTSAGERIAWLHSRGEVVDQQVDGDDLRLKVRLSADNYARFVASDPAKAGAQTGSQGAFNEAD
jgi:GTP-binding protein HflX